MKKSIPIFLFLILNSKPLFAQLFAGARSAALSGSSLTHSDAFSAFSNLSALSRVEALNVGFYGEQPFGISQIKVGGVGMNAPFLHGVIGVAYASYGNSDFKRQKLNFGYVLQLSTKLSSAASIGYTSTQIAQGYGNARTLWTTLSATYLVKTNCSWAGVIEVPISSLRNEEQLPAVMQMGLNVSFDKTLNAFAQVRATSSLNAPVSYSFGLEYHPAPQFFFRVGMKTFWQSWSVGVGTKFNHWVIDAASVLHPQLGMTPQISISYDLEE